MTLLGSIVGLRRRDDEPRAQNRRAIIDIGSNSIRLVVYDGPRRSPFILFNEKVMAGLGASLSDTGLIGPGAMDRGIIALRRFSRLAQEMGVTKIRCVATAAVRDAANGTDFVSLARDEGGLPIQLLSGRQEGEAAGYGVLSGIPDADGIVGDLGGGSLELARVRNGAVEDVISLPLGVLRLSQIRKRGKVALRQAITKALKGVDWIKQSQGLPFYMVGGSWRTLAKLDMQINNVMLPVIHQHEMAPERAAYLLRVTSHRSKASLKTIPAISGSRAATLADATALLSELVRALTSSRLVVSAHGLREGLLYQDLPLEERALDPLLVAAKAEGEAQGRFPGHGMVIDDWIAPLFPDDQPDWRRLRQAACLMADVGWRANPDFRAERGVEMALHSNWVGIDIAGRALLAQALYASFGGGAVMAPGLNQLADAVLLERATQWGLAIRLAQRLSGGVAGPLGAGGMTVEDGILCLRLPEKYASLYGESVQRRLKQLAVAMGLGYAFSIKD
jgi:exopolyphosphatase / guanosine-5'-triphosphate,3'-diphosphate pyrophosphatase